MAESLTKMKKNNFKKGSVIFSQGDQGHEMYIVEKGKVLIEIIAGHNKRVALGEFGPKDFFGEMALFESKRRTASATAIEDTTVIVINNQVMKRQLSKLPPWFVTMFKTLIERLRNTDSKILHDMLEELNESSNENDEVDI